MARDTDGWIKPVLFGGGAIAAIAWLVSHVRKSQAAPRALVGASSAEDLQSLSNLRTFRGKLESVLRRNPDTRNIVLWIRDPIPQGSGTIGGEDFALSLDNLGVVNWSLVNGGETVLPIERLPPSEYRGEFEAYSTEDLTRMIERVGRAIDRLFARVVATR